MAYAFATGCPSGRLTTNEVYHVRLDLLNVTEKPSPLWPIGRTILSAVITKNTRSGRQHRNYPEIIGLMAQVSAVSGERRNRNACWKLIRPLRWSGHPVAND